MKDKSKSESTPRFPFRTVLGRTVLWSIPVALLGGIICGVLGIYDMVDGVPLLGALAGSNKVVGISGTLAVIVTFFAVTHAFEEAGVLLGFILLTFFGVLVLGATIWFGINAFNFIRCAIAGGILAPAVVFPVTFAVVAKNR
ncbi:MAG: hypothetical protein AAF456_01405 [Planctomycetota bacterium]